MVEVLADKFCRVLESVVELVVDGKLYGKLVIGRVVRCYAYESKACKELHSSFCWVGREIQTEARLV
jgi:hypothetical protein